MIGIDILSARQKAESHLCVMRIVQRNKVQMSLSIFTDNNLYPKPSIPCDNMTENLSPDLTLPSHASEGGKSMTSAKDFEGHMKPRQHR